jgi:hypothetical protein
MRLAVFDCLPMLESLAREPVANPSDWKSPVGGSREESNTLRIAGYLSKKVTWPFQDNGSDEEAEVPSTTRANGAGRA